MKNPCGMAGVKPFMVALAVMMFAACSSSKKASGSGAPASAEAVTKVVSLATSIAFPSNMTAKCSYDITHDKKNLTLGGTLKMQRDRLIQLSAAMFGFEMARIEFTPDKILIIDRVNKRYVEGSYKELGIVALDGIDFNAMQALLWGELFVPGRQVPSASDFIMVSNGETGILTARANDLTVDFVTTLANGIVQQTDITACLRKDFYNPTDFKTTTYENQTETLRMKYASRTGTLPNKFILTNSGTDMRLKLSMSLSGIKTDTGNVLKPTVVDGSYTNIPVEAVMTSILSL